MSGDWLALGAVAALAAASVARRGSLATDEQIESLLSWHYIALPAAGQPFAYRRGTQWTVRTLAMHRSRRRWRHIQDVHESLPIQISNGEGEVFRVYARLVYKTLAGKKYVFNGDLAHDTQAWIDLVRPWTRAIDDGKLGTMLDRHGALELGQDPDQINELTP